eukprot:403338165
MVLPSEIFKDGEYYLYVLITLPIWILFVWYLTKQYQTKWVINNLESMKEEGVKFNSYLLVLMLFLRDDRYDRTFLSQLQYNHYIKCSSYYHRLDKKMNRKYQKLSLANEESHSEEHQKEIQNSKFLNDKNGLRPRGISFKRCEANDQKLASYVPIDKQKNLSRLYDGGRLQSFPISQQINGSLIDENSLMPGKIEEFKLGDSDDVSVADYTSQFSSKVVNDFNSDKSPHLHKKGKNGKRAQGEYKTMRDIMNAKRDKSIITGNHAIIQQEISEISLKKQKSTKSMIKHFFKHHLIQDTVKDYKIHILRIYFTLKILKNNMLAHFLLFNFVQSTRNMSIIKRNQILIHQKFFENKLNEHNQKNQVLNQINLQNMLELNQLVSKFERKLEVLSLGIQKFWKTLIQEKQSFEIFQKGLKISQSLNSLSDLYDIIQEKQGENREIKVYILMSGFYKYVVFKPSECMQEIQKSRQVYQTKKIRSLTNDTDITSDKGLIIANINLRKPMQIDFINKSCSKLIQYRLNEIQGMRINQLMPQIIGENHHKFLERFMSTGKCGMLNQRRELFIKKKNGYLTPIISYLCINTHNLSNLILIIEPDMNLNFFYEDNEHDNTNTMMMKNNKQAFMIADNTLRIYEMTEDLTLMSKLSNVILSSMKQNSGIQPQVDDLFYMTNQNGDIVSLINEGVREFEVRLKSEVDLLIHECIINQEDQIANSNIQSSEIQKLKNNTLNLQRLNLLDKEYSYIMRIVSESYMNGGLVINIIALKLLDNLSSSTEKAHNMLPQQMYNINQLNRITFAQSNPIQVGDRQIDSQNKSEDLLEEDMEQYDLSSQTSTTSSSTTIMQKFNQYSSSVKSQKLPLTLKFILQIMLVVFIIIIVTSSVSLTLTLSNSNEAREGIKICRLALRRLNRISQIRVIYRQIFSMAQNYVPSTSEIAPDRFDFYSKFVIQLSEELRQTQVELQQYDFEVEQFQDPVKLKFLMENSSVTIQERDLGQAVNLFVDRADDLIQRGLRYGKQYYVSQQFFFIFSNEESTYSSLVERDGYFIIENGNQDLFQNLLSYAKLFNQIKKEKIQEKVDFSSIMSWICIGIICLCGIVIIPLFGRIQSRVLMLMKIFFDIEKNVVKDIQDRLAKFDNLIKPTSHQEQQQQIQTNNNDQKNQDPQQISYKSKNIQQNRSDSQKYGRKTIREKSDLEDGSIEQQEEIKIEEDDEFDEPNKNESNVQSKNAEKRKRRDRHTKDKKFKKSKKQRNKNKKSESDEEDNDIEKKIQSKLAQQNQQNSLVQFFNSQINKRKLKQSLFILLITIAFNGYFLGTYFMSTKTFDEAASSIDLIFTLQQRKSCAENVIHATTEALLFNQTYLINDGDDEIQKYFNDFCSAIETTYLYKVKRDRPQYFDGVYPFLDQLESGVYCQTVFGDGSGDDGFEQSGSQIDVDRCKSFANGISQQGISQLYQQIYQMTNQIQLEYANMFKKDKAQNLTQMIQLIQKPVKLFDVIEILLQKPDRILIQTIQDSLDDYFSKQALNFIMIYFVFLLITVVSMAIFLLSKQLQQQYILQMSLRDQGGK